jgi:cytochrome c biogenesis protein CcdA
MAKWGRALMLAVTPVRHDRSVVAVVLLVVSLGLVDSINPVTILIAAYLASMNDPRPRLAGFVLGVFAVYLLGGIVLMLGSAELLRGPLSGVEVPYGDVVSVLAGAAAVMLGGVLWVHRARWRRARPPGWALEPRSTLALGAAVTAIDLPTAFPYFGAIGVIVTSGASSIGQVVLLVLFNAVYVLPPALILVAHLMLGDRCQSALASARAAVERVAAPVITGLTMSGGCVLIVRGVSGLA